MQELLKFHSIFYSKKNKIYQDTLILKYTEINSKKRRRPKNNKYNTQSFQCKYYIPNAAMIKVPVCLNTFVKVLGVSRFRINRVVKNYKSTGEMPTEKRGGYRKLDVYKPKETVVINFLNKLKCVESHYCRSAVSTSRKYLSSELNIRKLYRMYIESSGAIYVKEGFFRKIFNTNYNLGFGNPRTDVCSTCLKLEERIKSEKDKNQKQQLITEKRVHKLRAKAFFEILREDDSKILKFSFDCQKNQPLPKLPDQATYYSRQVYIYNFTIVQGCSKDKINSQTVTSYCWTENEFSKGSNEIASCVYDTLQITDVSAYEKIQLMADGCGGQNKNSTLLAMAITWLFRAPKNIKSIEVIFPVTGHSYIPPDRVFGLIEKETKKREIILLPEDYREIFSHYATVKRLGVDCQDLNWKEAKDNILKPPSNWHFQFQNCKRFLLIRTPTNVLVQGEAYYKSCLGTPKSICKRGKTIAGIQPSVILKRNTLKKEKKDDVNMLLSKHYGEDWRNNETLQFEFYKTVLDNIDDAGDAEDEILCELQENIVLEPRI